MNAEKASSVIRCQSPASVVMMIFSPRFPNRNHVSLVSSRVGRVNEILRCESKVSPMVRIARVESNHIGEIFIGKVYLTLMHRFVRIRASAPLCFVMNMIFIFIVWVNRHSDADVFGEEKPHVDGDFFW